MKAVLQDDLYLHFMKLSIAMSILFSDLHKEHLSFAASLLHSFFQDARILYSDLLVTYNCHALLHLPQVAEKYGNLTNCTAYPYENQMHVYADLVRGTGKVAVQLAKRIQERTILSALVSQRPQREFKTGFCVHLKGNKFGIVASVNPLGLEVAMFNNLSQQFSFLCDSALVSIYNVRSGQLHTTLMSVPNEDVVGYAIHFPMYLFDKTNTVEGAVMALRHLV
jgi:hypothetical protein